MNALPDRRARFVEEYLIDFNQTQAAVRAGYSARSAYSTGHALLADPAIRAAIDAERARMYDRTTATRERVMRELGRLAFVDMASFCTWEGGLVRFRDSSELSPDDTACISAFEQQVTTISREDGTTETRVNTKFRLHDKGGALGKLCLHFGLTKQAEETEVYLRVR